MGQSLNFININTVLYNSNKCGKLSRHTSGIKVPVQLQGKVN